MGAGSPTKQLKLSWLCGSKYLYEWYATVLFKGKNRHIILAISVRYLHRCFVWLEYCDQGCGRFRSPLESSYQNILVADTLSKSMTEVLTPSRQGFIIAALPVGRFVLTSDLIRHQHGQRQQKKKTWLTFHSVPTVLIYLCPGYHWAYMISLPVLVTSVRYY